jgi:hypothetical protein
LVVREQGGLIEFEIIYATISLKVNNFWFWSIRSTSFFDQASKCLQIGKKSEQYQGKKKCAVNSYFVQKTT